MSVVFKGADYSAPISFVGMYSDGTPMVKTDQWDGIINYADTMVLKASSLNDFVVGMFLYDALMSEARWKQIKLILPYIPGARQDRSNPTGDVLTTLNSVAGMLNARPFSGVVVADPHSEVAKSLISNLRGFPLHKIYGKLWRGYGGVICPDKGAYDRASIAHDVLGGQLVIGSKVRDVATGRLSGFDVTVKPGMHYIVIDDICDGGGTFVGLGEKIREQGAFADLFVTHGIFSKGTAKLKEYYKNIYTTDTRDFQSRDDVHVFGIVEEMEKW